MPSLFARGVPNQTLKKYAKIVIIAWGIIMPPAMWISHKANGNTIIALSPSNNWGLTPHNKVQHSGVGYIVWLPSNVTVGSDDIWVENH